MKKIYFIGIGGIGTSALAQYFKDQGADVSGSDRDPAPQTQVMLEAHGIEVKIGHSPGNVPSDTELVIYSDAVVKGSDGFVERERAHELGIQKRSYFQALGEVSAGRRTVAIAGTHGKT